MRCSRKAKIWLAYARSVDNTLSSFEILLMYCTQECLYNLTLANWSKSKPWNCVSQAVMFLWFCQQAIERTQKSWIYQGLFFCFTPECKRVSVISRLINTRSALPENNSKNMNWLSLAFLPSIWKTEPDFHLKLSRPRISRGHFFLTILFRIMHDGLSERGTTRSLYKQQCTSFF